MNKNMNCISGMAETTITEGKCIIHRKLMEKNQMNPYTEGTVIAVTLSVLFELLIVGSNSSAVDRDDVHRKTRRHRRIRTGSNPTSIMNKHMKYISGMAEKMIFEGKCIIHRKLKKNTSEPLYGGYCDGSYLCLCYLSFFFGKFR